MKSMALMVGLLVVLVVLLGGQLGCNLTQTQSEHMHIYDRGVYHDVYLIPDDLDTLLLLERPTRLSRWLVTY